MPTIFIHGVLLGGWLSPECVLDDLYGMFTPILSEHQSIVHCSLIDYDECV